VATVIVEISEPLAAFDHFPVPTTQDFRGELPGGPANPLTLFVGYPV